MSSEIIQQPIFKKSPPHKTCYWRWGGCCFIKNERDMSVVIVVVVGWVGIKIGCGEEGKEQSNRVESEQRKWKRAVGEREGRREREK